VCQVYNVDRKRLDTEHRAKVKAAPSQDRSFVMENEIAKEALSIIPFDEREQRSLGLVARKEFTRIAVCRVIGMPGIAADLFKEVTLRTKMGKTPVQLIFDM